MMKKIIMTGGGTAGHVMVNTVLAPRLIELGWEVIYIGSYGGVEERMMEQIPGVTYYGIHTGKLRRYFSLENFKDIFKVLKGISQAYKIIKETKPDVIFSCGGFVSVPVVLAGWLRRRPCIIRETDYTIGLANKISIPFAEKVCVTFPDTLKEMPNIKRVSSGPIIRPELKEGSREKGLELTGFDGIKPILLVIGGSQGAKAINDVLRLSLDVLIQNFDIIHLCGKGNTQESIKKEGYVQFEYVHEDLKHLYAVADSIVSRAGSNAVFEGMLLNKPMLLIPLSKKVSRGDQILNARYVERQGCAKVLLEEQLNQEVFVESINKLHMNRQRYIKDRKDTDIQEAIDRQIEVILQYEK